MLYIQYRIFPLMLSVKPYFFVFSSLTRMALTEAQVVSGHIVRCHPGTFLRSL